MHSPSTPRREAILFFLPWPTHQSPKVFWLAEAINIKGMIDLVEIILSRVTTLNMSNLYNLQKQNPSAQTDDYEQQ